MAISSVPSRFSLLKVDDEEDVGRSGKQEKNPEKGIEQQAKKKNKKKIPNPAQVSAQQNQLRNMAFGAKGKKKGGGNGGGQGGGSKPVPAQQWDEWKKKDDEFAQDTYEKDLEKAFVMSKLQFKEEKKTEEAVPVTKEKEKKKKKKDKPAAMSLDKFNKMLENGQDVTQCTKDSNSNERKSKGKGDFDTENGKVLVEKALQKEKIQEAYKKQYAVENVRTQNYENQIEKKDKEITMLKDSSKKMATELGQVKKRNQQLCHILAQGEMKDKTAVLLELDELKQVRDEMMEEVTELTSQLEKEKSKNHSLKSEIDKMKAGKHK